MSASCSGNCDSCGESCSSRSPESLLAPANKLSNIKHVIAVVSGKGGVGKSTVTSMMAVAMTYASVYASSAPCAPETMTFACG